MDMAKEALDSYKRMLALNSEEGKQRAAQAELIILRLIRKGLEVEAEENNCIRRMEACAERDYRRS